ncbi:MAG: hypothetical protein CML17_08370 [Pusillimonas sp.]|jgi:soluble cytochrome b562/prefoldin subunit 5|nr:hypothetical protein [Pusillimonas sp.]
MEELNSLIEEAIVKYDNFGEKKPTKQSTIKAYRDIICKLHTAINPQSENKYPNKKELCKIFENHNIILKKFDNGEWLELSVATKKNYLNVIINIIPKIKSIEADFSKSQKWVNKKVNELKVILDNYKNMIDTLNKCKKAKKQEDNDLEKLKEIVENPIDEPIEPIIEEPVIELTSMEEINELIKLWTKQTELQCKRYSNEVDLHNWMFELETTKHELQILQKKIDTLSLRIDSGNKAEEYLTDQLQNVREQIKKFK